MAGTELGKAYVQIVPSAKGISKGIEKEVNPDSTGGSLGAVMGGAMKKALLAAGIGVALAKAISASLKEGAELEQSLGGVETLFKDNADTVIKNAQQAYQTAGMSANEYMKNVTSFSASLLQSLGGDTAAAADVANMAMIDMSDNANKMGTDMESIQNAYQGFAKQNYTMLDNLKLGYGGTKTEMERLLADAQKITGVEYNIDNLSDVYEAIHVIQGELDITGTTAKEASSTLAGSMASMKSAFSNVMGQLSIGEDVGPALNALATTITTFLVGNLLPAVWNILSALPSGLVTFISSIGQTLIPALSNMFTSNVPAFLTQVQGFLDTFTMALQTKLPEALSQGVTFINEFINGILQSAPQMIETGMGMLTQFLSSLYGAFPQVLSAGADLLLNLVNGLVENYPALITSGVGAIVNLVASMAQNYPAVIQTGIEIIGKLASGLIKAIPTLIGKIPTIITSIINTFKTVDWAGIGRDIIAGIVKGLKSAGNQIWEAVKGILGNFKEKVLDFFGIHSPARWGIYVGEMIDLGLARGIEDNMLPFINAVDKVKAVAAAPFNSDIDYSLSRTISAVPDNSTNLLLGRFDHMLSLLEDSSRQTQEIKLIMNGRETGRALREMGVAFA